MSFMLPHLHSGWAVDQAILSEEERLVIIRFGHDYDSECMKSLGESVVSEAAKPMDEILYSVAEKIKSFAIIYLVDVKEVPDFNTMYELYDPVTVMFFFRNKHMMIDLATSPSPNHMQQPAGSHAQEFIDIVETIYRGARKGRGLVMSPKDTTG
eukprot:Skav232636  [mRNA]  locus=scaffold12:222598:224618:+ [translate_table: standard]